MNMELIKTALSLTHELNQSGVIDISNWFNEIHMKSEVLLKEEGLTCEYVGGDIYPYKISKEIDGIIFFARCQEKELANYPQFSDVVKKESLPPNYLEEDVDLSGGEQHVS
jgi:hypothetical protein